MPPGNNRTGLNRYGVQVIDHKDQQVRFLPYDYQPLTLDTDFPNGLSNALWVGATGNVEVITAAGTTIVIPGVQGGSYLIGQFIQVVTTNTTVASPEDNIRVAY